MIGSLLLLSALGVGAPAHADGQEPDTPARRPSVIEPVHAKSAPVVFMVRVHDSERYTLRLFDEQGRLRAGALVELRDFLRDRRRKIDHPIHWRLATLLVAISAHFDGAEIQVVSGYRHVNRHHKRSKHTRGHALDFRVVGVDNRSLFELLRRSFADIGVGYYPNSTFVHLDVRRQDALWVDYSGPGQTPCYSRDPKADLRSGRAEALTYAAAIEAGCRRP